MADKQNTNNKPNGDQRSSGLSGQSESPSLSASPGGRVDLYHQQDSSLVDDYAERSRIRIQELKKALTERPSRRKKPRPMSAVFLGPTDGKPGNEVIYSNISKYIENQKKQALTQQVRVSSADKRLQVRRQNGKHRGALTPDLEIFTKSGYNRKFLNGNERSKSAYSWKKPDTPDTGYRSVKVSGVRSSVAGIPEVDSVNKYGGVGRTEFYNNKGTGVSGMSDRQLIRSWRESLENKYTAESDEQDSSHRLSQNYRNPLEQQCNPVVHPVNLNENNLFEKSNSQALANGRMSDNSSITSDISYDKFSKPLLGESVRRHANDESSFDSHSMDTSSIVSIGNGKAPSSIDSENRSETSCGRSIDSEVAGYTKNMSMEGLSRYTRHSRGASLDESNNSDKSNHYNPNYYISSQRASSTSADSRTAKGTSEWNGWSYPAKQLGILSHKPTGTRVNMSNSNNGSPSVSDISSTKGNLQSSQQDCPLPSLLENSEYTVNARIRPSMSDVSRTGSDQNRYPWQSGPNSIPLRELSQSNRFARLPRHYRRSKIDIDGQVKESQDSYLKFDGSSAERRTLPSEGRKIKSTQFAQQTRPSSTPSHLEEQLTHGYNSHGRQPLSVSLQKTLAGISDKSQPHFNRLMSRVPSRRPARPHSVAITERPSSRQSDGSRRSPFLCDSPLSRESRQKRLSTGESYGRTICVQGTLVRRPSSTDISYWQSRRDNSGLHDGNDDSKDSERFPYLSSVTRETRKESERVNLGLVRPKSNKNGYGHKSSHNSFYPGSSTVKHTQDERFVDAKSSLISDVDRLPERYVSASESHIEKSKLQPGKKTFAETDLDLGEDLDLDVGVELGSEIRSPINNEQPNKELATHVARLFEQQISKKEEDEDLNKSRDKSVEEIEQMVNELERNNDSKVKSTDLQLGIPEELEVEIEGLKNTPKTLVEDQFTNHDDLPERQNRSNNLNKLEAYKLSKKAKVPNSHSSGNCEATLFRIIYVSKYMYNIQVKLQHGIQDCQKGGGGKKHEI